MVGLGKNVRFSLLIILSGIISFPFDSFSISSQVVLKNLFTVQKYSALNTGAKEFYLSENEKHIIGLCNLVRYDPKAFVSEIIISSGYDTSNEEISGLIKELKSRKSVFPLMPAFSLFKSALGTQRIWDLMDFQVIIAQTEKHLTKEFSNSFHQTPVLKKIITKVPGTQFKL